MTAWNDSNSALGLEPLSNYLSPPVQFGGAGYGNSVLGLDTHAAIPWDAELLTPIPYDFPSGSSLSTELQLQSFSSFDPLPHVLISQPLPYGNRLNLPTNITTVMNPDQNVDSCDLTMRGSATICATTDEVISGSMEVLGTGF